MTVSIDVVKQFAPNPYFQPVRGIFSVQHRLPSWRWEKFQTAEWMETAPSLAISRNGNLATTTHKTTTKSSSMKANTQGL